MSVAKGEYELVQVCTPEEWKSLHELRQAELFERKANIAYDTSHPHDFHRDHFPLVLKLSGRCIGTARLDLFGGGEGAIRLVAIQREEQGSGHGRILEELFERFARLKNVTRLYVNANPTAVGYYERLGFIHQEWDEPSGPRSEIAQDCIQMVKYI